MDVRVIAIDITHDVSIPEPDKKYIKSYREVRMYDKERHVHCCEFTPSHEMWFIENQLIFNEEFYADEYEELREKLTSEYCYEVDNQEVAYYHVRDVDEWEHDAAEGDYYIYGDSRDADDKPLSDADYDEEIQSLIEHFRCNCVV